jgi:predicted Zn-dependent peptidase
MLAETVTSPKLSHWEVSETLESAAAYELAHVSSNPEKLLLEAVHQAAYGRDSSMGRTFYVDPTRLTHEDLRSYRSGLYTAGNMTVVGAGVSHDALVAAAQKAFGGVTGKSTLPAQAKFVGGTAALETGAVDGAHLALTFDASSNPAAAAVLQELVSQQLCGVSAKPFFINYSDSRLFGVCGSSSADAATSLTEQIVRALKAASGASDSAIHAAKLAAKTRLALGVEHPNGAVAALLGGSVSVDKVDADAVKSFASSLLKSSPALALVGNTLFSPTRESVQQML